MNDESWAAMNKERKELEQQMTIEQTDLDELMKLHASVDYDLDEGPFHEFCAAAHAAMPQLVAEIRELRLLFDAVDKTIKDGWEPGPLIDKAYDQISDRAGKA